MMTQTFRVVLLGLWCGRVLAQQADPCAGAVGAGLAQCRDNQLELQRQQLSLQEQELQRQQQGQQQLVEEQRRIQQQLDELRMQNESLRKQMERDKLASQGQARAPNHSKSDELAKSADLKNWRAENPWFGSDYARTAYAVRYVKQLEQEQPELVGRPLLDAVSAKVAEKFGSKDN